MGTSTQWNSSQPQKTNEILMGATIRMRLEDNVLGEMERQISGMQSHLYEVSRGGKFIEAKQSRGSQALGGRGEGRYCLMGIGFLFGMMTGFWI